MDIEDSWCDVSAFLSLLPVRYLLRGIVAVFSSKGSSSSITITFSILLLARHVNIIPQTAYLESPPASLFASLLT